MNKIISFDNEFKELDELLLSHQINSHYDKILMDSELLDFEKVKKFPELTNCDLLICTIAALISVIIDVVFVGTPDVVKLYKGGENFDGSRLTAILRKIGNDSNSNTSKILHWFSDKCKVPYDISAAKDTLTPNNHRLRSFSHDPLFGLLFAVADIIMGTTTCINDKGILTVLVNETKASTPQKLFAVFYYLGHLVSDMFTARGLPIPGFFMSQFFQTGIGDSTIAGVAENMYKSGYDLRHLGSMSVPVLVKKLVIDSYMYLNKPEYDHLKSFAANEKKQLDYKLKKCKLMLISDSVATTGNLLKFILPPSCGNPCAINVAQWFSFVKTTGSFVKASSRDTGAEQALHNREVINTLWSSLLADS